MPKIRYSVSISLDGYVAGPNQGPDQPLGERGMLLHDWIRELKIWRAEQGLRGGVSNASTKVVRETYRNIGAVVMGRNMFGGGPGPWKTPWWDGWWGTNPPFHLPVYVLTHYAREPLVCEGGTTFHFVTNGMAAAVAAARKAAGTRDVAVSGGASTAKQLIAAGLVSEIWLHLVPVFLGDGVRLFEARDLVRVGAKQVAAVEAPGVTHVKYRLKNTRR